jgi:hypothetical protein
MSIDSKPERVQHYTHCPCAIYDSSGVACPKSCIQCKCKPEPITVGGYASPVTQSWIDTHALAHFKSLAFSGPTE